MNHAFVVGVILHAFIIAYPAPVIIAAYELFLIFFVIYVIYCVQTINRMKDVCQTSAVWSIILSPISWIWFYSGITDPLKIIVGTIPPPETIDIAERKRARKAGWKRFWRTFLWVVIAVASFLIIIVSLFSDRQASI